MPGDEDEIHWYCIHTKPKSEHIAAAHLRQLSEEIEVFCPRLRYQKSTRRGRVWFSEALFPGYTFARLNLGNWLRAVNTTNCVLGVVRFGDTYPPVPEEAIESWREAVNDESIIIIEETLEAGDEVEVMEGPARGIEAIITRVIPGRDRVRILMEMLGEQREVEVSRAFLKRKGDVRTSSQKSNK